MSKNDEMKPSESTADRLLALIATTVPDELDCDGCLELLPIFVEVVLADEPVPQELQCVEIHLSQCKCCHEEYVIILDCMREPMGDSPGS
jgi:hypothetical protein